MRTTIRLDDDLLAQLKEIAAKTGRTVTAVIDDALRESLARRKRSRSRPVKLPVFRGTGLQPGVDLHDSAALLELMEDRDAPS